MMHTSYSYDSHLTCQGSKTIQKSVIFFVIFHSQFHGALVFVKTATQLSRSTIEKVPQPYGLHLMSFRYPVLHVLYLLFNED